MGTLGGFDKNLYRPAIALPVTCFRQRFWAPLASVLVRVSGVSCARVCVCVCVCFCFCFWVVFSFSFSIVHLVWGGVWVWGGGSLSIWISPNKFEHLPD